MGGFPETLRFELGIYVDQFVRWAKVNFEGFFEFIKDVTLALLLNIEKLLLVIPWWIVVILIFLLGWRLKSWKSGLLYSATIFLIGTFGLWGELMTTLGLVITSVIISLIIGIPVGILTAYSDRLEIILKPILDAMQTMPSFVYLIPAIMLFSLGLVPAVFATTIYAIPPVLRLTNLAIRRVPKEMKEAAQSFGSSKWQTLFKVELPQALPTIMTGINQTIMMAISMVVTTSMVGARGLGLNVITAINRIDIAMGFEAGVSIVIMAVILDRVTQGMADKFRYPESSE
jgi:glycine betaine/proline transport system permease protein